MRTVTSEIATKMTEARKKGMPISKVSKTFKVSPATVYNYTRKNIKKLASEVDATPTEVNTSTTGTSIIARITETEKTLADLLAKVNELQNVVLGR